MADEWHYVIAREVVNASAKTGGWDVQLPFELKEAIIGMVSQALRVGYDKGYDAAIDDIRQRFVKNNGGDV